VTLYRITRRVAVPAAERADFVHQPTTTPEVTALDPRAPDQPEAAGATPQTSAAGR
jgi:hypothetical protein